MKRYLGPAFAALSIAFLVASISTYAAEPKSTQIEPTQVQWLTSHAASFKTSDPSPDLSDLEPLREMIGDARIVALGEGTHGTREYFQMKHRIVQFLASEMGFTIFSIEASTPEAFRVNDYVLAGEGYPKPLIGGMYFWTWNTEEVLAMVEWMHDFNKSGKGTIEFTGFDMQTPDVAMENVVTFLKSVDPDRATDVMHTYSRIKNAQKKSPFGVATWTFPVDEARGKRVRYTGYIKTEDVNDGWAGLWWRVDGVDDVLAFDNMQGRGPTGTTDWELYSVELDVAEDATNINFGVLMPGSGKAWFDGLQVELDGKVYSDPKSFDFDFEADQIVGYYASNDEGYQARLVGGEFHSGEQSLRLEKLQEKSEDAKQAAADAEEVFTEMVALRERYQESAETDEVEWAIHNARIVHQCMRSRSETYNVRDEAMAENVAWILEQNPGAKIVLWAHNGHVARQPYLMGSHLAERFGDDYLPVGFIAEAGDYIAWGKTGLDANPLAPPSEGSVESYFAATEAPRLILDLRLAEKGSADSGWLTKPRLIRSIGAVPMEEQFHTMTVPDAFDLLIYFKDTTPAAQLDSRPAQQGR
jgi:erythromycin esterase-like protein